MDTMLRGSERAVGEAQSSAPTPDYKEAKHFLCQVQRQRPDSTAPRLVLAVVLLEMPYWGATGG